MVLGPASLGEGQVRLSDNGPSPLPRGLLPSLGHDRLRARETAGSGKSKAQSKDTGQIA